jgi:hypothetical protein
MTPESERRAGPHGRRVIRIERTYPAAVTADGLGSGNTNALTPERKRHAIMLICENGARPGMELQAAAGTPEPPPR